VYCLAPKTAIKGLISGKSDESSLKTAVETIVASKIAAASAAAAQEREAAARAAEAAAVLNRTLNGVLNASIPLRDRPSAPEAQGSKGSRNLSATPGESSAAEWWRGDGWRQPPPFELVNHSTAEQGWRTLEISASADSHPEPSTTPLVHRRREPGVQGNSAAGIGASGGGEGGAAKPSADALDDKIDELIRALVEAIKVFSRGQEQHTAARGQGSSSPAGNGGQVSAQPEVTHVAAVSAVSAAASAAVRGDPDERVRQPFRLSRWWKWMDANAERRLREREADAEEEDREWLMVEGILRDQVSMMIDVSCAVYALQAPCVAADVLWFWLTVLHSTTAWCSEETDR
jgi:hypothetical protein